MVFVFLGVAAGCRRCSPVLGTPLRASPALGSSERTGSAGWEGKAFSPYQPPARPRGLCLRARLTRGARPLGRQCVSQTHPAPESGGGARSGSVCSRCTAAAPAEGQRHGSASRHGIQPPERALPLVQANSSRSGSVGCAPCPGERRRSDLRQQSAVRSGMCSACRRSDAGPACASWRAVSCVAQKARD